MSLHRSHPVRLGRARDWSIGVGLLLALLVGVHLSVGWGPLLAPWRALSLPLLAGLVLLSLLSYGLRALRVYEYFRPCFKGCMPAVLRMSVLHNAANNLLPMRAGELVFPWLMHRYFGFRALDATAALLWIRLLDLHFILLIAIALLAQHQTSGAWGVVGLLWLAALTLLGPLRRRVARRADMAMAAGGAGGRLACGPRWNIRGPLYRLIARVALSVPSEPGTIARVYLLTALVWLLKLTAFALVLHHFLPLAPWQLLTGVMGGELSSILPFHGVAGAGSYELAMVAALVPAGVDPALALMGAVNLHLFLLGVTLLLGGLALLLSRQSPCTCAGDAWSQLSIEGRRPDPSAVP